MAAHLSFKEREDFTRRLKASLRKVGLNPTSPTQLLRACNSVNESIKISLSTVHKWLLGDALPDTRNMEIVAKVCQVCPYWLRTGSPQEADDHQSEGRDRPPTTADGLRI